LNVIIIIKTVIIIIIVIIIKVNHFKILLLHQGTSFLLGLFVVWVVRPGPHGSTKMPLKATKLYNYGYRLLLLLLLLLLYVLLLLVLLVLLLLLV